MTTGMFYMDGMFNMGGGRVRSMNIVDKQEAWRRWAEVMDISSGSRAVAS